MDYESIRIFSNRTDCLYVSHPSIPIQDKALKLQRTDGALQLMGIDRPPEDSVEMGLADLPPAVEQELLTLIQDMGQLWQTVKHENAELFGELLVILNQVVPKPA